MKSALLAKIMNRAGAAQQQQKQQQKERDAAEGLRILQNAIDYLGQFGTGNDLEFSHARIILHGRMDAIYADFGVQRVGSPARVD